MERNITVDVQAQETTSTAYRTPLIDYLRSPSIRTDKMVQYREIKYVLLDYQLYKKGVDGLLLRDLYQEESMKVM